MEAAQSEELVLSRNAVQGEWKIYRHSGLPKDDWRLVFSDCSESKAVRRFIKIYSAFMSGSVRVIDPDGKVIRDHYVPPARWKTPKSNNQIR